MQLLHVAIESYTMCSADAESSLSLQLYSGQMVYTEWSLCISYIIEVL